jgi:hypothetical protein
MSGINYNPENLSLNEDDKGYINDQDKIYFDSVHRDVKDLKANGKDWIIEAVNAGISKYDKENCQKHWEVTNRHGKWIKLLTWWQTLITVTVIVMIVLLILYL